MTKTPQVYKANSLIEASYRLSVAEQRIILAAIGQVRRDEEVTDEIKYQIRARDIAEISGTDLKTAYKELEKAALRLKRREVWINLTPEGEKHAVTMVTGWIQSIVYRKSEGMVELRFSKDMLPYLTNLKGHFTRYALSDIASMTSGHAIRLYELLVERMDFKERKLEVQWMRKALQLENSYPAIKDLKKWVIEPAIKQINEHSPIQVGWTQEKTGRRVTHFHFTFESSDKNKEKQETTRKDKTKIGKGRTFGIKNEEIEKIQREGESFEDAAYRAMFEMKQMKINV